jgi:pimeloyl-ACP methyl ester carboxylesterase
MTAGLLHKVVEGKGEPIVLVHGSASDYRTWEKQMSHFAQDFQVLAYSRRFHWPNPKIPEGEDYSMALQVEDLKGFITHHGFSGVHLVGHSYGAFLSLLMALEEPRLIKTLTLAEPPVLTLCVSSKPKPPELLRLLFQKPALALSILKFGIKGIAPTEKALRNNQPEKAFGYFGKAVLGSSAFDNLSPARKEQALTNFIKMEFLGSGFLPLDKEAIRQVEFPVLLIAADKSPELFRLLIKELQLLIPHAQNALIRNASHNMHEENPFAFNREVERFIKMQAGQDSS